MTSTKLARRTSVRVARRSRAVAAAVAAIVSLGWNAAAVAEPAQWSNPVAGSGVQTITHVGSTTTIVTVNGPGKTVYVAGQLARDAAGGIVGPGDMRAQLEQTFKNLDACLKAAGAGWADVVKTNTFVTNYAEFAKCSDVRMRYFGVASPTSTTIQISGLAQPEAMVEIELIAVVN